jgi:hypothetical protein
MDDSTATPPQPGPQADQPTASPPNPTPYQTPPPTTNLPPSPLDTKTDSNNPLHSFAAKFGLDSNKPFFPVNTMRLFYLIITDGLTTGNHQAIDQVNQAIPKISSVFDARDRFLEDGQDTNPLLEVQTCSEALNQVLAITDTPTVRHTFDLMFSDLYPLQENLLISLDRHLNEELLSEGDLLSILKIRAMDSVVYSSIVNEIIKPYLSDHLSLKHQATTIYQTTPLHWQINISLQINDFSDAIIHAKDDLDSGNATIIDILKKTIDKPDDLDRIVTHVFTRLQNQSGKLPFSQPLQTHVKLFNQALTSTISSKPVVQ